MYRPYDPFETEIEGARREFAAIERELTELKLYLLARKYRPDQPRVPAGNPDGGQWTYDPDTTGSISRLLPAVRRLLRPGADPTRPALGAALTRYAIGSSGNGPGRQTVAEFNARAFARGEAGAGLDVRTMRREEVAYVCPRLDKVAAHAERAVAEVAAERPGLRPAVFGTAVHTRMKHQIDALGDPNFLAEKSFLKSEEARYGDRGSIRIDVFERVRDDTVCVYDLKTGTRGLNGARLAEISDHVLAKFPSVSRLIVTEVRVPR